MENYKLRAECMNDVSLLLRKLFIISVAAERVAGFPDVIVTFTSPQSLDEIRAAVAGIEDGHVMLESLNYEKEYTGERYFR